MNETQNGTTPASGVVLDGIGELIEDRGSVDHASALCLLSLAYSAERIAAALERLATDVAADVALEFSR